MKIKNHIPIIANIIIFLMVSVFLFSTAFIYTWKFFAAYLFVILGGCVASIAVRNWGQKHRRNFPINSVFVVLTYLYWAATIAICFLMELIIVFPLRSFFLLEFLPLGILALLILVFQMISAKFESDDQEVLSKDVQIIEINNRISALQEKSTALNESINNKINLQLSALHDKIKYSDILSVYYTDDMIQLVFNDLASIELEMDSVLSIQSDEVSRLEQLIAHLITTITNNDAVCKASKR